MASLLDVIAAIIFIARKLLSVSATVGLFFGKRPGVFAWSISTRTVDYKGYKVSSFYALQRGGGRTTLFAKMSHRNENDSSEAPLIVSSVKTENSEAVSAVEFSSTNDEIKTHLIVHFDINETILLGDQAGGDSLLDSWHKMFAKSAFCQIPESDQKSLANSWEETQTVRPTHWWDGQEIGNETSTPPLYTGWEWPNKCCPYYRTSYKSISKNFVDHHGKVYKKLFDKCQQMRQQTSASIMPSGSHILPALYHTLHHLITNEHVQPFSVVFRTFGDDLPDIAKAVADFANGNHPEFPDINYPPFVVSKDSLFQGRWKKCTESGEMIYQLWDLEETKVIGSGDYEILQVLERHRMCGICDDYPSWAANKWHPTTGKPVWVPQYHRNDETNEHMSNGTTEVYDHHILFDDNIHNLPNDGIACIRKQRKEDHSFVTLDCQRMHRLQGIHLVRVPTIEPVMNHNWFVNQIAKARSRLIRQLIDEGRSANLE